MHVQKAVEESKRCPGNPSFQMLPSAFKLYVKWDLKRKRKRKHSLFLKHHTEFRRSRLRLQLWGSAFYLSFGRLLEQRVGKLPSCSFIGKAGCVETGITVYWSQQEHCFWFERVYALTRVLYSKILWLGICWEGSRWNSLLFDYDQRFEPVLEVAPEWGRP